MTATQSMPDIAKTHTTILAPGKVNLNLRITGRRDDGYHLLDSVVVFTHFGDKLTIGPAAPEFQPPFRSKYGDQLTITGDFAPALARTNSDQNLCLRAMTAFRRAGGQIDALRINLEKNIPIGAGLGGGSSDAAALLRQINLLASTPLPEDMLFAIALELGADIPVCLSRGAIRMRGIGERLDRIVPPPHGIILLAKPRISLATGRVFGALAIGPGRDQRPPLDQVASSTGTRSAADFIKDGNDLFMPASSLAPEINNLIERMQMFPGAIAAQMTGSGSACFAIFETDRLCQHAEDRLRADGIWAVATEF